MKKWAWITVFSYVFLLSALYVPLGCIFWEFSIEPYKGIMETMWTWQFVLVQVILVLVQVLLLIVPVKSVENIQIKRRHIYVPIIVTGFLAGLLVAGLIASLTGGLCGEDLFSPSSNSEVVIGVGVAIAIGSWIFWVVRFRKYSLRYDPDDLMDQMTNKLYKGSILELLVAVPCHIIVRGRGDCSAPVFTFFGIAAGVVVMFAAFGPGVYYLLIARRQLMLSKRRRLRG